MTRLSLGAISNSDERPAGRAFLTFSFFSFFALTGAVFAATGAAFATFAAFAAFAGAFLLCSQFHLIQLCQVVPFYRLIQVYISEICL